MPRSPDSPWASRVLGATPATVGACRYWHMQPWGRAESPGNQKRKYAQASRIYIEHEGRKREIDIDYLGIAPLTRVNSFGDKATAHFGVMPILLATAHTRRAYALSTSCHYFCRGDTNEYVFAKVLKFIE